MSHIFIREVTKFSKQVYLKGSSNKTRDFTNYRLEGVSPKDNDSTFSISINEFFTKDKNVLNDKKFNCHPLQKIYVSLDFFDIKYAKKEEEKIESDERKAAKAKIFEAYSTEELKEFFIENGSYYDLKVTGDDKKIHSFKISEILGLDTTYFNAKLTEFEIDKFGKIKMDFSFYDGIPEDDDSECLQAIRDIESDETKYGMRGYITLKFPIETLDSKELKCVTSGRTYRIGLLLANK